MICHSKYFLGMIKVNSSLEGKVFIDSDRNLIEVCAVAQASSILEYTDVNGLSAMDMIDNADLKIKVNSVWRFADRDVVKQRLSI